MLSRNTEKALFEWPGKETTRYYQSTVVSLVLGLVLKIVLNEYSDPILE
jgi:hypothetical protein